MAMFACPLNHQRHRLRGFSCANGYDAIMSRRLQFSLKWVFVAMLVASAFFGGIHFERERRRREDATQGLAADALRVFYFQDLRSAMPEPVPTPTGE